jgi:hypothetical protein
MKTLLTCAVLSVSSILLVPVAAQAGECRFVCVSWDSYNNCIRQEQRCTGDTSRPPEDWRKPRYGVDERGPYRHRREDSRRDDR